MFKGKKILVIIIVIVIALSAWWGAYRFRISTGTPKGKWIVKVVDSENKKDIENSLVVVTDLNKKFEITKSNNVIYLPQKPVSTANGKYPHGYTIITYSKGYLPRIDHNMTMGKDGEATIELELSKSKPEPMSNQSYVEEFHKLGEVQLGEFISYNLGDIYPIK